MGEHMVRQRAGAREYLHDKNLLKQLTLRY